MGMLTSVEEKQFQEWMEREGLTQERVDAKKKNGWWRNFWSEWGPDLLFVACVLGGVTALTVIYLTLETLGWFNL